MALNKTPGVQIRMGIKILDPTNLANVMAMEGVRGDPKTKSHRTRICRRKPMPLDESYLLRMTSVFQ